MRTARLFVMAAVVAAVGVYAVTDAMAQFGGGMPGGRARGGRTDKSGPSQERPTIEAQSVTDLVEFRLALLQEALKLTREQERAWAVYEEKTTALAGDIAREQARLRSAMSMNAMQQVNHAVDTARDRLTAWEDIASAARMLYEVLTPDQKALADARFPSIVSALSGGGQVAAPPRFGAPAGKSGPN